MFLGGLFGLESCHAGDLHHSATETQDKVKRAFFLDFVVTQGSTVLELITRKHKSLIIRLNALFFHNLKFHFRDRTGSFGVNSNSLTSQSLDKKIVIIPCYAPNKMQVQSPRLVFVYVLFVKLVKNFVAQVDPVLNLVPFLANQEKPLLVDRY